MNGKHWAKAFAITAIWAAVLLYHIYGQPCKDDDSFGMVGLSTFLIVVCF